MASLTDTFEGIVLDHIFGISAMTVPGSLTVKLTTTTPTDSAAGTEVSTGTWTNYSAPTITNDGTGWSRTGNDVTNDNIIDFGTATTTGDVTLLGFELWNAGTRWAWGTLASVLVQNGNPVYFAAGDLSITLD